MKKGIIFDMDGVLVDSMHLHAWAWRNAFGEVGIDIVLSDILELEGSNDRGVIERVLQKKPGHDLEEIYPSVSAKKHALFNADLVQAFPGMEACVSELHKHFSTALVSGSNRSTVEAMVQRFYPDVFDVMISGNDVVMGKPSPEPYIKAVELLGLPKEECIVIENAPLGVESAKGAGIFCIGLPTYVDASLLKQADMILNDHTELIAYLKALEH